MEDLTLHVVCVNRADGTIIWGRKLEPKLPESERVRHHGYAGPTPATDGGGETLINAIAQAIANTNYNAVRKRCFFIPVQLSGPLRSLPPESLQLFPWLDT